MSGEGALSESMEVSQRALLKVYLIGNPKPYYLRDNLARFQSFIDAGRLKINSFGVPHNVVKSRESYDRERAWEIFFTSNMGREGDLIITSDCDEIPRPQYLKPDPH